MRTAASQPGPPNSSAKVDRMYEDRLSDAISDELCTAKSGELQEELRRVRADMERHEWARPPADNPVPTGDNLAHQILRGHLTIC